MEEIQLLAKLGEYQYMERLIKEGELYLRPMSDFIKMDSNNGIGDKYENMISYLSPKDPSIKIVFKDGQELALSKNARITYGEHSCVDYLIYCMSMVNCVRNGDILTIKSPNKLNKIGSSYDTIVIVLDNKKFIERIINVIQESSWRITYKPINYYPDKDVVLHKLGPFDKREIYSYQNEFRFCIDCNINKPYSLKIGNIEDIAELIQVQPTIDKACKV